MEQKRIVTIPACYYNSGMRKFWIMEPVSRRQLRRHKRVYCMVSKECEGKVSTCPIRKIYDDNWCPKCDGHFTDYSKVVDVKVVNPEKNWIKFIEKGGIRKYGGIITEIVKGKEKKFACDCGIGEYKKDRLKIEPLPYKRDECFEVRKRRILLYKLGL